MSKVGGARKKEKILPIEAYEKAFPKTEKTDAILVVQGRKLHVNKALLSYHSDYFQALFNSDFMEKSMEEIRIDHVDFKEFATLLSLVHDRPIMPAKDSIQNLLELAERFMLPGARRHVEHHLAYSSDILREDKVQLAVQYNLENLMKLLLI